MKYCIFMLLCGLSYGAHAELIEANIEAVEFQCKNYGQDGDFSTNKQAVIESLEKLYGESIVIFGTDVDNQKKWEEVCTYKTLPGQKGQIIVGHTATVYVVRLDQ